LTLPGCGVPQEGEATPLSGTDQLGAGTSGPVVAEAQAYLNRFGYFPNAELAAEFPSWRPVMKDAPKQAGVLDAVTIEALARFQRTSGLPVTGTLTPETLAAMRAGRCGVPDGDVAAEKREDKFAVKASANRFSPNSNITYRFASQISLGQVQWAQAHALINAGIQTWAQFSNLTFTEVTNGGDMEIVFQNIDGPDKSQAQFTSPPFQRLVFDTSEAWTVQKVLAVATHEAGHMNGLNHSTVVDAIGAIPVMYPINVTVSTLTDDDAIGTNSIFNSWEQMPGLAIDVGVNTTSNVGTDDVWVLGTDCSPYRWNGAGWTVLPGVFGTHIDATPFGTAVVVGMDQRLYWSTSAGAWVEMPGGGQAFDVGVSRQNAIWVIGLDRQAYVYNPVTQAWNAQGGPANQIAIDVDSRGKPWVVTSAHEMWSGPAPWSLIGTGLGSDVGVGGKKQDWVFAVGSNSAPYLLDVQSPLTVSCGVGCTLSEPATSAFVGLGGTLTRISAGTHGRSWVLNAAHQIFRRLEMR
jgi:hypothetical protein